MIVSTVNTISGQVNVLDTCFENDLYAETLSSEVFL